MRSQIQKVSLMLLALSHPTRRQNAMDSTRGRKPEDIFEIKVRSSGLRGKLMLRSHTSQITKRNLKASRPGREQLLGSLNVRWLVAVDCWDNYDLSFCDGANRDRKSLGKGLIGSGPYYSAMIENSPSFLSLLYQCVTTCVVWGHFLINAKPLLTLGNKEEKTAHMRKGEPHNA